MEAETLQLLTRVLKEEEERLLEDVGKLEEEVGEEGMKKRGEGGGAARTNEREEDEAKNKKVWGKHVKFWNNDYFLFVQKKTDRDIPHMTSLA